MPRLERRKFLQGIGGFMFTAVTGCADRRPPANSIDQFITAELNSQNIAGLALAVLRDGEIAFSRGYGLADIANAVPMTANTIQNIASVSKPVTLTAVMQCVERNQIALDADVNDYLPRSIRNPLHPDTSITPLQLLTHYSSIADGSNYYRNYRCGATQISLHRWIDGYLQAGGEYFEAGENFHDWAPGAKYAYNNVAFGLLSYLVQVVTDRDFEDYCQEHIFAPLEMADSTWRLANANIQHHATPYLYLTDEAARERSSRSVRLGQPGAEQAAIGATDQFADCIYDHPNYADGFLRTSVNDMSRFLRMTVNGGALHNARVLRQATVEQVFAGHGITWKQTKLNDELLVWTHGGSDPGVSTAMHFRPDTGDGVLVFANSDGVSLERVSEFLFSANLDNLD